jgi:hypothetical protein
VVEDDAVHGSMSGRNGLMHDVSRFLKNEWSIGLGPACSFIGLSRPLWHGALALVLASASLCPRLWELAASKPLKKLILFGARGHHLCHGHNLTRSSLLT